MHGHLNINYVYKHFEWTFYRNLIIIKSEIIQMYLKKNEHIWVNVYFHVDTNILLRLYDNNTRQWC
jgi:hypothetical protein